MSSGGIPSSWATIWAKVVSWPWPWVCTLRRSWALPVGCTRSSHPSAMPRPRMSMCLRGPAPTPSVKKDTPMPMSGSDRDPARGGSGPALRLLLAQLLVAGDAHGLPQGPRVVAGVVLPAGWGGVGKLLGAQQVLHAQLGGVHVQLVGQAVDHALDEVDRFGDAERAGVGDATGRLVACTPRSPCSGRPDSRRSR